MKNVTISLDDELHHTTRVEAAKAGKSMSRYVADLLETATGTASDDAAADNPQVEALERIFAGPMWDVTDDGRMPTAQKRNERMSVKARLEALRQIWESPTLPLSEDGRMPNADERNARH
ncbi:hypothetical protein [Mesorhizobium xinjiangense]|uniref:hypothetical protein n=1 Tax=Mesorhizobium xinjiangense TaxID=2678685 RepID=UPI0012EDD0CE|nr:hypothetical protein [Mesorhizobium xinjiangense]